MIGPAYDDAAIDARIDLQHRHVRRLEPFGASAALLAAVDLLDDLVRDRARLLRREMAAWAVAPASAPRGPGSGSPDPRPESRPRQPTRTPAHRSDPAGAAAAWGRVVAAPPATATAAPPNLGRPPD